MDDKNKKIILTVGLPRSGKTTWSRKQGHPIVNPDSIRLAMHGQRFYGPAEPWVWAMAYLMVDALLSAGHDTVIVDATNVTYKRRHEWPTRFSDRATVRMKIIPTSPRECVQRAKDEGDTQIIPVILKMAKDWDLPRPWSPNDEVSE